MTADAVRADRFKEVRDASLAWQKSGAIDEATRSRIDGLFPDDRSRLGRGLAVLAGVASFFGGIALTAAIFTIVSPDDEVAAGVMLLAHAALFAFVTEVQTGRLRRSGAGAELATALLAGCLTWGGVGLLGDLGDVWSYAVTAVIFAFGAYRWGMATLAAGAYLFTLLAFAQIPGGRLWWIGACLVAIALAVVRMHEARLSPAHRRCFRIVFGMALLALYLAVHYDSVKLGMIEWIGEKPPSWGWAARPISAVLTALLPLLILFFGIKRRDRIAIAIGALLTGISLATWRFHWPWLPMWLTLTAGGAACFVTAILVRRFLDRSPSREWRGITADPLFDDPAHTAALRVAAVAATLGHAPQAASGDRPFQAGGGTSGGGGAQGQF